TEPGEAPVGDDGEVLEPADAFARFLEEQGETSAAGSEPMPHPEPEPDAWSIDGPADDEHEPYHPTEEPREAPMNDVWSEPADDLEEPSGEPAENEDEDEDV